jgi:ATP-dependent helicase YprA (DUF1998 family)
VRDELHTYRGRQGADVAMLVRRVRERLAGENLQCVGTSATMASREGQADSNRKVAEVASRIGMARSLQGIAMLHFAEERIPRRRVTENTIVSAFSAQDS